MMDELQETATRVKSARDDVAAMLEFVDELFPKGSGQPVPEVPREYSGERGL